MNTNDKDFAIGTSYRCITRRGPSWTVIGRGEGTVTVRAGDGPEREVAVRRDWHGFETCRPMGHYDGGVILRSSRPETA